jgi:hypothetical protein
MLTKIVLPLLSSGRMPKWLPTVLGGACAGAAVGYLVARDGDRPRATARVGTTVPPITTTARMPRSTPYPSSRRPPPPYPVPTLGGVVLRSLGDQPLGFVYEAVPGRRGSARKSRPSLSSIVDVTSRPQTTFQGERLVVPSGIANHFEIRDIKIGRRSQLASAEALPAAAFSENAETVHLILDLALVGQDVTLVVENITSKPQRFTAVLFGSPRRGLV